MSTYFFEVYLWEHYFVINLVYVFHSCFSNTSNESEDEFHDALRPITMEDLSTACLKLRNSKDFCGAEFARQEASWNRV